MYPIILTGIVVAGLLMLVWRLARDKKRAMLLTIETTDALNAAREAAHRQAEAADAALAKTQTEISELKTTITKYERKYASLCKRVGLPVKDLFTEEEMQKAERGERLTKALGADIHHMVHDARRRGIVK